MMQTANLAETTAIAVPQLQSVNKCVNRAGVGQDASQLAHLKRAMLIARGFDPERLVIADVRTRMGQAHTVLLARTQDALFVLDTLEPEVVSREDCSHSFVYLLCEGEPMAEAA